MNFTKLAVEKIANELKEFKGGNKETVVSKFVAQTLTMFCEKSAEFAEVVYKTPRTLSDCCAEVMDGCGSSISDIEVYRKAVQHYFPNADIHMNMEINFTGDAPTAEEIGREPKKKPKEAKKPKTPKTLKAKSAKPGEAAKPKTDCSGECSGCNAECNSRQPAKPEEPAAPASLQISLF